MIANSKLALVAALATIGAVSSAYAQSTDRYGSVLPYYYDGSGAQIRGSWGPQHPSMFTPESAGGERGPQAFGGLRLDASHGLQPSGTFHVPGVAIHRRRSR